MVLEKTQCSFCGRDILPYEKIYRIGGTKIACHDCWVKQVVKVALKNTEVPHGERSSKG